MGAMGRWWKKLPLVKGGLQQRAMLSVALLLLAVFAVFFFLSLRTVNHIADEVYQERIVLGRTIAGNVDLALRQAMGEMKAAASEEIDLQDNDWEKEKEVLREVRQRLGNYGLAALTSVALLDASGKVLVTESDLPTEGEDRASIPAVAQALQGTESVSSVEVEVPGRDWLQPAASVAVPVKDLQGAIVAVLNTDVAPQVGDWGLPSPPNAREQTYYMEVINEKGVVVTGTLPGFPLQYSPHRMLVNEMLETRLPNIRVHSPPKGEHGHLITFAPLQLLPWGIVIEEDKDIALALPISWRREVIILGVLSLLLALGASWIVVGRMVRPIKKLTYASQRIAAGDLSQSLQSAGEDEVGTLTHNFELMRQQLKASLEKVENWNRELEQHLHQRTQEVERRNRELAVAAAVATKASQLLTARELSEYALEQVMEVAGLSGGEVFIQDNHKLVLIARRDRVSSPVLWDLSAEETWHTVARTREPLIIPDVSKGGAKYLVAVPLMAENRTIGIMRLWSSAQERPSPEDIRLLQAVGHQVGVAVENSFLYQELKEKEDLQRKLLEKTITVQEEERKRVARELHDEMGQAFTALSLGLGSIEQSLSPSQEKVRQDVSDLRNLASREVDEVRRLVADLRPDLLDDMGLVAAIQWYLDTTLGKAGVEGQVETEGLEERLPPPVEIALFRVVQEAVTNIARHAQATWAKVRLEKKASLVRAVIEDNGKGFELSPSGQKGSPGRGFGLMGMAERVELLGGSFHIRSQSCEGTRIEMEIPLLPRKEGYE